MRLREEQQEMWTGAITVFMTLVSGMILSLVLITMENVRFLTGECYVRLSAKGALHSVFGEYNRELYEAYGLLGYGGYSQKNQDELSQNIARQLQIALGDRETSKSIANLDLYRIHDISCDIHDVNYVTESEEFYRQIKLFLASDAVETIKDSLFSKEASDHAQTEPETDEAMNTFTSDAWRTSLDQTEKYEKGEWEQSSENAEAMEQTSLEDHAKGNPLESFCNMMRDGILQLVCDEKKLPGEDAQTKRVEELVEGDAQTKHTGEMVRGEVPTKHAEELAEEGEQVKHNGEAAGLLKKLLGTSQNTLLGKGVQPVGQKLLLMQYASSVFSNYTKDRGRALKCGLEYLIEGKENERDCLLGIVNRLLVIRTMINYAYVSTDERLQAESLATATAVAGVTGLPPIIQAVQQTILLILSVEESLIDITALLRGYKVPLFKDVTTFQMHYSEICMVTKAFLQRKANAYKTENGAVSGQRISYMQYLELFLSLTSEESLRKRSLALIESDLRKRYNQTFCIDQCICRVKADVMYRQSFLWNMSKVGAVKETRQFDIRYQY